jgi:hypothetical protein
MPIVAVLDDDRHDACSSAWGSLLELSLALAPMAPSLQGLHLCVLQGMGVLTEVHVVIRKVGCGLAMRKQTQQKLARSPGPCGAPPASVLLFLNNQSDQAEVLRSNGVASGWGVSSPRWGKGQGGGGWPMRSNL